MLQAQKQRQDYSFTAALARIGGLTFAWIAGGIIVLGLLVTLVFRWSFSFSGNSWAVFLAMVLTPVLLNLLLWLLFVTRFFPRRRGTGAIFAGFLAGLLGGSLMGYVAFWVNYALGGTFATSQGIRTRDLSLANWELTITPIATLLAFGWLITLVCILVNRRITQRLARKAFSAPAQVVS